MDPNNPTDSPKKEATLPQVFVVPRRCPEGPQGIADFGIDGAPNLGVLGGSGPTDPKNDKGDDGSGDSGDEDPFNINSLFSGPGFGGCFGSGKASAPDPVDPKLKLEDIGGLDDHIRFLEISVLYPILKPQALQEWGIDPPKGILFHGPPGTGKTLLAKTLAAEATNIGGKRVSFFYQKGSESFSMWFGETEQKLKALFDTAKKHKPSIIFFDEIDGLAPSRSGKFSYQINNAIVTTLLGLIDSVKRGEVFIIAATNRVDSVDPAVLRPGRFDKTLEFSLPDEAGREKILQVKTNHWKRCRPSGDLLKTLAQSTVGYTGADLAKLAQDAIYCAATRCETLGLPTVSVIREDWMKAKEEMSHSPTSVFGSSLIVSQPLPQHLQPFVGPRIQEIISAMRPFLPREIENTVDGSEAQICLGTKAFLLFDYDVTMREFLHFVVSRGILAEKEISEFSVFELNVNSAFSGAAEGGVMGCVENVVDQVVNSAKPSILFLPHLDLLDKMIDGEKKVYSFYAQLERVRGSRNMIFATACFDVELNSLHSEFKTLFGHDDGRKNKLKLRPANTTERREFFSQLFWDEGTSAEDEAVYQKVERAVEATKGSQPEEMIRLYEAFKNELEANEGDMEKLNNRMDFRLSQYAKNKLQN